MTPETWLGDTRLLSAEPSAALVETVRDWIRTGVSWICVDASQLIDGECLQAVMNLERCAGIVQRAGGHLSVICPLDVVRRAMATAHVPVLSDRPIAERVLS